MALRGKFYVKDLALSVYECYLTGHGSTGKFEMGTKHRMRNEVPQIGLGFKFNFILSYIFPFLVSPFLVLVTPLALWRQRNISYNAVRVQSCYCVLNKPVTL